MQQVSTLPLLRRRTVCWIKVASLGTATGLGTFCLLVRCSGLHVERSPHSEQWPSQQCWVSGRWVVEDTSQRIVWRPCASWQGPVLRRPVSKWSNTRCEPVTGNEGEPCVILSKEMLIILFKLSTPLTVLCSVNNKAEVCYNYLILTLIHCSILPTVRCGLLTIESKTLWARNEDHF